MLVSPETSVLIVSFGSQMSQLQFSHSIAVLIMTSRKGTTRQKISQMSIIFVSEVGGISSILLLKMVVITNMMVGQVHGDDVTKQVFVKEGADEANEEQ